MIINDLNCAILVIFCDGIFNQTEINLFLRILFPLIHFNWSIYKLKFLVFIIILIFRTSVEEIILLILLFHFTMSSCRTQIYNWRKNPRTDDFKRDEYQYLFVPGLLLDTIANSFAFFCMTDVQIFNYHLQ